MGLRIRPGTAGGGGTRRAGAAGLAVGTALALLSCGPGPESAGSGNGTGRGAANAPAASAEPAAEPAATPARAAHDHEFSVSPAEPLRAGEYFAELGLPAAYTPRAPHGGTDEYRCFILDANLAAPSFLTGTQFLPQNPAIVHHAILFQIHPENAERARQHDRDTPGQGWPCFGNAGLDDGTGQGGEAAWIGSWAPGTTETLLAPKLGHPIPVGGLLVIQIHYNLLATDGRPDGSDRSSIRLRLNDGTPGMTPLTTELLLAPVELPCQPAESGPLCDRAAAVADVRQRFGERSGETIAALNADCNGGGVPAAGSTQRCDTPVTAPATIHALGAHMHLLGRSLTVELNPGTARSRTLLDVPNYDFDDQAVRPLREPVRVEPGDILRVTCTHDATLRQRLPQLRRTAPRYVVWGEGTTDEMCLGIVIQTSVDTRE